MEIVGSSAAIQSVIDLIQQVARTPANVLICGESGTGKELVARNIHLQSKQAQEPFIALNCGAIPAELLESELFGHEKGAFTGAANVRQGKFEIAENGTIFLDEIGDMPLAMQVKLLRVLQEKTFERVGGNKTITTNVRVIAASNQDLAKLISEHKFREDLFYRLNVFPIKVPPLRGRSVDVVTLTRYFLDKICLAMPVCSFSAEAEQLMISYSWPGNIRELANLVERMCILYPEQLVSAQQLSDQLTTTSVHSMRRNNLDEVILVKHNLLANNFDLKQHVVETEIALITQALANCHGVVAHAAKMLGVRRTTLIEKIKKYQSVKNVDAI